MHDFFDAERKDFYRQLSLQSFFANLGGRQGIQVRLTLEMSCGAQ